MSETPASRSPDEIKAEIEATRAELADTVGQLGARLDVRKKQAKQGATYAGAAVGAVVLALVVVKIVKKVRG